MHAKPAVFFKLCIWKKNEPVTAVANERIISQPKKKKKKMIETYLMYNNYKEFALST